MIFDRNLLFGSAQPNLSWSQTGLTEQEATVEQITEVLDLTSLNGNDTDATITQLCEDAKHPLRGCRAACESLVKVAAVCVFPTFISPAKEMLQGTGIRVATVSGAFPHGLTPLASRLAEIHQCERDGADEIDIVIPRYLALQHRWSELYDELAASKQAAGNCHLKVILATGELTSDEEIFNASIAALMAGADFIKTSTGKEAVNATLAAGKVMKAALDTLETATGNRRGLKAAGGIKTVDEARSWIALARTSDPHFFRIGASSLLKELKLAVG